MSRNPKWMEVREVLVIHEMLIARFGGSTGIRDEGLLESALARPQNLMAYSEENLSLAQLAACYAFGISSNHPFVDGNKRSAFTVAAAFLDINGYELAASQEEAYLTFTALAAGNLSESELAHWIEARSARK